MDLNQLQDAMLGAMLHPGKIPTSVHPCGDLSPTAALDIYRNNYITSLTDTLAQVYPVTQRLVGDTCFAAICHDFIAAFPSTFSSLDSYGKYFGTFCEGLEALASLPYLGDVIRLEWFISQSEILADRQRFDFTALATIPEAQQDGLILTLVANAFLLCSRYPVASIWQHNQTDPPEVLQLSIADYYYLIWRPDFEVRIDTITREQFILLTEIKKGATLGQISQYLLTHHPEVNMIETLPVMFERGYIEGFHLVI